MNAGGSGGGGTTITAGGRGDTAAGTAVGGAGEGGTPDATDIPNAAASSIGINASVYREFDNGSNPIVGLRAVTIEFWTKFTANDSRGGNMLAWWRCHGVCDPNRLAAIEVNNRDCGGSQVRFILHFESGDVNAVYGTCTYQTPNPSVIPYFPNGKWHHVAGVYDGSQMRLYVDGSLVASAKASGPIYSDSATTTFYAIGRECFNSYDHGHAIMDEFRVSNNARYTATFIPAKVFTLDANTLIYLKFNEGSGGTYHDETAKHFDFIAEPIPPASAAPAWVTGIQ